VRKAAGLSFGGNAGTQKYSSRTVAAEALLRGGKNG